MKKIVFKPMTWAKEPSDPADGVVCRETGWLGTHCRAELEIRNAAKIGISVRKTVRRRDLEARLTMAAQLDGIARRLAEAAYALLDLAHTPLLNGTMFCYRRKADGVDELLACEPFAWGDGGPASPRSGRVGEFGYAGRTPLVEIAYGGDGAVRLSFLAKRRGAPLPIDLCVQSRPGLVRAMASPLYRYACLLIDEADREAVRKPRRRAEAEERETVLPVPAPSAGLTDFRPEGGQGTLG